MKSFKILFVSILSLFVGLFFGCNAASGDVSGGTKSVVYKITFNSNNELNEVKTQSVARGKKVNLLPNEFEYLNHTFDYWSTTKDSNDTGAQKYADEENISVLRNLDLYAIWLENNCIINFDLNNGTHEGAVKGNSVESAVMDFVTFADSKSFKLPLNSFSVKDKAFKGWTLKPVASGDEEDPFVLSVDFSDGQVIPAGYFTEKVENYLNNGDSLPYSLTLYAVWGDPDYYITYNINTPGDSTVGSGNINMSSDSGIIDVKKVLAQNTFEVTDYGFAGWSKTAAAAPDSSINYENTAEIILSQEDVEALPAVSGKKTLSLYAVWTKKLTVIKFDPNVSDSSVEGEMENQSLVYNAKTKLTKSKYSRADFAFGGWNTKADGTGISYDDEAQINLSAYVTELTLYAQWKPIWIINFEANLENTSGTMAFITAVNGDKVKLTNNAFAKERKKFIEWNTKADGSGTSYSDGATITVDRNLTLYAQWKNLYRIYYYSNNGNDTSRYDEYVEDSVVKLPATTFTYQHHSFKEYNSKADGTGTSYAVNKSITLTQDVNLYVIWQIATYKVYYYLNKPSPETDTVSTTSYSDSCEYGNSITVISNPWTLTHYTFSGWNTKSNGTGTEYTAGTKKALSSDLYLYAQWTGKTYIITFTDSRPNVNQSRKLTYTFGSNVTLTPEGTSGGSFAEETKLLYSMDGGTTTSYLKNVPWVLEGWTKTSGSKTVDYTEKKVISNCNFGNITLYSVHYLKNPVIELVYNNDIDGSDSHSEKSNYLILGDDSRNIKLPASTMFEYETTNKIQWNGGNSKLIGFSTEADGYAQYKFNTSYNTIVSSTEKLYEPKKVYGIWINDSYTGALGKGKITYNNRSGTSVEYEVTKSVKVGKYEVTQGDFYKVLGERKGSTANWKQYPITNVTLYDCARYCNALSAIYGKTAVYRAIDNQANTSLSSTAQSVAVCKYDYNGFRLLTTSEWVWAANNANSSYSYSYSNNTNTATTAGWYSGNSNNKLQIIGQKDKSTYQICDLNGNAAEWTAANILTTSSSDNYIVGVIDSSNKYAVICGGSYSSTAANITSKSVVYKNWKSGSSTYLNTYSDSQTGFRVCFNAE